MPLELLNPLTPHELAVLAANDHAPNEQVDWLQDRETPAADVCLLFGQGLPKWMQVQTIPPNSTKFPQWEMWHLPQATFAVWAGCLYGAERRRAVEACRVLAEPGSGGGFFIDGPFEDNPWWYQGQPAAQRELRRRVLRLLPEVTRELKERPVNGTDYLFLARLLRAEDLVPPEPYGRPLILPEGARYRPLRVDPRLTTEPRRQRQ